MVEVPQPGIKISKEGEGERRGDSDDDFRDDDEEEKKL